MRDDVPTVLKLEGVLEGGYCVKLRLLEDLAEVLRDGRIMDGSRVRPHYLFQGRRERQVGVLVVAENRIASRDVVVVHCANKKLN